MRWIGSVVIAACLVAAGATRPAHAEQLDPSRSELASAAKALAGKIAPRRHGEPVPDQRRSAGALPAVIAPATDVPPPPAFVVSSEPAIATAVPDRLHSSRSSRGPPR